MTEEQIIAARKIFVKYMKNVNKQKIYKFSLAASKNDNGFVSSEVHQRWCAFLEGYKAALEQTK